MSRTSEELDTQIDVCRDSRKIFEKALSLEDPDFITARMAIKRIDRAGLVSEAVEWSNELHESEIAFEQNSEDEYQTFRSLQRQQGWNAA